MLRSDHYEAAELMPQPPNLAKLSVRPEGCVIRAVGAGLRPRKLTKLS